MSERSADETGTDERSPDEIEADIERTREELGDTVEALAAKTDVKTRAKEKVTETKETISQKVSGMGDSAKAAAPESASAGAQQAAAVVKENPENAALAGAFAAGLIAGWIARGR
jgi:Protein of unknown function (DUF3618)